MNDVLQIPGTIAVQQIQPALAALEEMGVDVDRVLARAGLAREELRDPHARVRSGFEYTVWNAIEELTGDPLIGLRVAERVKIGALGAFEYVIRNSATMRQAIEAAQRFERVVDDLTTILLVEEPRQVALRFAREGGYPQPPRAVECLFSVLIRVCGELVPNGRATEARFVHRSAVDPAEFRSRFGCEVQFGAAHDDLVFPVAALDMPLQAADIRLGSVLEDHLQALLAALPNEDPFPRRARGVLLQALADGTASLEHVASELHVSPRTLRRRLEEHGSSYKLMLDQLRRELAFYYVEKTGDAIENVASRLGFTEPSTFYRAFKRWSGTTPALHRQRARAST